MKRGNEVIHPVPPVVKKITVPIPVQEAFELFTAGLGSWWPLHKGHSVGGQKAKTCAIEGSLGGRVFETTVDGTEYTWGTIQAWDPPTGFRTTWHPGNSAERSTLIDVKFSPVNDGTEITLTHSGWEARGKDAMRFRDGYNTGWDSVLLAYTEKIQP
ncbi:MAG: SRPBCC domain-containing protein [Gammaproteobacteria bacterium]|nr:SRPBCC domain-containing protein [Gammaproteobacteria bacterium]